MKTSDIGPDNQVLQDFRTNSERPEAASAPHGLRIGNVGKSIYTTQPDLQRRSDRVRRGHHRLHHSKRVCDGRCPRRREPGWHFGAVYAVRKRRPNTKALPDRMAQGQAHRRQILLPAQRAHDRLTSVQHPAGVERALLPGKASLRRELRQRIYSETLGSI